MVLITHRGGSNILVINNRLIDLDVVMDGQLDDELVLIWSIALRGRVSEDTVTSVVYGDNPLHVTADRSNSDSAQETASAAQ